MARAIAARKRKKKPVRRRRQWRGSLKPAAALASIAATFAVLGLLVNWMNDPRSWPVSNVQVEGQFRYLQPGELQAEVEPLSTAGFFAMEVGEIQKHLGQLPWVDQVSVRRVWPDRLDIEVTEQRPIARWSEHGFLNRRGEIFVPDGNEDLSGLVTLHGPDGYQQRVLEMYARLQELLQPLQLEPAVLKLDARRAWSMRLDNGLIIEIGRKQPVQRIARFVHVYHSMTSAGNQEMQSVDLRYSNGFAVRWHQKEKSSGSTG